MDQPRPAAFLTVLPCHWVIERLFGSSGRNSRLSKDCELPATEAVRTYTTMMQRMLRSLAR